MIALGFSKHPGNTTPVVSPFCRGTAAVPTVLEIHPSPMFPRDSIGLAVAPVWSLLRMVLEQHGALVRFRCSLSVSTVRARSSLVRFGVRTFFDGRVASLVAGLVAGLLSGKRIGIRPGFVAAPAVFSTQPLQPPPSVGLRAGTAMDSFSGVARRRNRRRPRRSLRRLPPVPLLSLGVVAGVLLFRFVAIAIAQRRVLSQDVKEGYAVVLYLCHDIDPIGRC